MNKNCFHKENGGVTIPHLFKTYEQIHRRDSRPFYPRFPRITIIAESFYVGGWVNSKEFYDFF